MTLKDFFITYYKYAKQSEQQTKVPALFTLAQAALESAYGAHAPGYNFFGIKDTDGINGNEQLLNTHEVIKGKSVAVKDQFRKYNSPAESFIDHGNFLIRNKRYKAAFNTTDSIQFAKAVAAAGYASDPKYADKLIAIIHTLSNESYNLN